MTISEQFVSILIMIVSGILIGATIDGTRICLSALSPKSILRKIAYGVEISVWAILGAATFYIMYIIKGGEWRLVDPLAQISGVFLYESVFQPVFRFFGRVFVLLIIKPIVAIFKLIISIITGSIRLVIVIFMILLKPFYKIYAIFKRVFYRKFSPKVQRFIFKKK